MAVFQGDKRSLPGLIKHGQSMLTGRIRKVVRKAIEWLFRGYIAALCENRMLEVERECRRSWKQKAWDLATEVEERKRELEEEYQARRMELEAEFSSKC